MFPNHFSCSVLVSWFSSVGVPAEVCRCVSNIVPHPHALDNAFPAAPAVRRLGDLPDGGMLQFVHSAPLG